MDNRTIAEYLQHKINRKRDSLKYMDKRHKIPKRIKSEIEELKAMVKHLIE
tara:strand:+ start:92 stop:244 length:153 start_codon:yes stop_codon:yes gene_type:complete